MSAFSVIVAGVGTRVGDSSSVFATEIKRYVNFRYKDIWGRFNWGVIDWKSNWEHLEEGHGRDILLKDWAVKREVTPPQWLLEIING